jgi:hypothetical protein
MVSQILRLVLVKVPGSAPFRWLGVEMGRSRAVGSLSVQVADSKLVLSAIHDYEPAFREQAERASRL